MQAGTLPTPTEVPTATEGPTPTEVPTPTEALTASEVLTATKGPTLTEVLTPTEVPPSANTTDTVTPVADSLSVGAIIGLVFGVLIFIGLMATIIILCICCLTPSCPCYYKRPHSDYAYKNIAPDPPVVVMDNYQPPPLPADNPKPVTTDYQPHPAVPTTTGYH